uniref:Carboxypeptidase O n=1 Tax=Cacopsylla melanoneura TaxID=428564 RepID=A0A8D9B7K8_9HEMI
MWLIPWSYTKTKVEDYEDLMFMGRKAIEALKKVNGIHYDIGSSTSLLYATAGKLGDFSVSFPMFKQGQLGEKEIRYNDDNFGSWSLSFCLPLLTYLSKKVHVHEENYRLFKITDFVHHLF